MSKFHPLEVSNINQETDDCVSVTFAVPDDLKDLFSYSQGQHVSLRADIDGEDVRRSYSICTSVAENKLRVAVRHVEDGRMSGFINDTLKVGDLIDVFPPAGHFYVDLDAAAPKKTYVAFAGGSGITPVISNIKTTLETEPDSEFVLFYANRTPASTVFRSELSQLKNRFMTRFSFFHFLSEENIEFEFFNGFLGYDKTKEICANMLSVSEVSDFLICGPGTMISEIEKALQEAGVDDSKIHFELFSTDGVVADNKANTKKTAKASTCKITMTLDGVKREFNYAPEDGSVLDAASKTGADVPYSCRGGVCCTCRAKVIEGEVEMAVNYGLEPDEVEAGYVLTCQSTPTTKTLVLNYDK